jgi:hypothetical protein
VGDNEKVQHTVKFYNKKLQAAPSFTLITAKTEKNLSVANDFQYFTNLPMSKCW